MDALVSSFGNERSTWLSGKRRSETVALDSTHMRSNEVSPDAITAKPSLNQRGIRTARGGNWHVSSVANVLSRAVARAVYEASALPFPGALPGWKEKFGA